MWTSAGSLEDVSIVPDVGEDCTEIVMRLPDVECKDKVYQRWRGGSRWLRRNCVFG
jgi:hypothetical protein